MDPVALLLVVGSAGMHAAWNYLAKRATDSLAFLCAVCMLVPVIAGMVMMVAWLAAGNLPDFSTWKLAILGGFVQAAYISFMGAGYNRGDLSVVYPLSRGSAPIFIAVLGLIFLQDPLSVGGVAGIALVLIGTLVLTADAFRRSTRIPALVQTVADTPRPGASVGFALFAAITIALYHVVDKAGAQGSSVTSYMFLMETMIVVGLVPLLLNPRRAAAVRSELGGNRGRVVVSAVLLYVAYLLVVAAMMRETAAYVAAARNLSILVGIGLGAVRLSEGRAAVRLVAGAVMLAGITALALGA